MAARDELSFVIVGAGQAGYWAARTLRDACPASTITLIGAELHPPYERPQLSKQLLIGSDENLTLLDSAESLSDRGIQWRGGGIAREIDRGERTITLEDGSTVHFDRLLLATGGRCRTLKVAGLAPEETRHLRTADESLALRKDFQARRPLVIVGGGWIGLEVAAAARSKGISVTLVEAAPALCGRALPPRIAKLLEKRHRAEGADIRLETTVSEIAGSPGDRHALLSDGTRVPLGVMVIGIGMVPNSELAVECGLDVSDGIVVDAVGRTSDPAIFATGDVARYNSLVYGGHHRPESWSHAQNHAVAAALAMAGKNPEYDPVPWFWSDQYDLNIQLAGRISPDARVVVRGDPDGGNGTIFYLDGPRLTAAVSFNQARENRVAKRLIESRVSLVDVELKDSAVNLQQLLQAA